MPFKKVCLACKNAFISRKRATKYCSNLCKGLALRVRKKIKCKNCNKTFEARPFEKRQFCSSRCQYDYRIKPRTRRKCQFCGKTFYARLNRRPANYCSRACRNKAQTKYIELKCQFCGKKFIITKGKLNHESFPRQYCSRKCYDLHRTGKSKVTNERRKTKTEKFIETKFNLTLEQFLKEYYLNQKLTASEVSSMIKVSATRVSGLLNQCGISKRTHSESMALGILHKKSHGQHRGYRKDLSNQYFDSAWEANYYRYLQFKEKKFQYEPQAFKIILPNGKITHYIPDFLIDDIFVEVKGYWRPDAKVKFRLFKKQYYVKAAVLGPSQYKKIKNLYAKTIPNWEN